MQIASISDHFHLSHHVESRSAQVQSLYVQFNIQFQFHLPFLGPASGVS